MEDWLAAGSLSKEEFDQLVRLMARYFLHDVDQFDHWKMPGPDGNFFFVDFSWQTSYPDDPDVYRPMWPPLPPGAPGWTLWRREPDGSKHEIARYGTRDAAEAYRTACVHSSDRKRDGRRYEVTPPPAQVSNE